MYTTFKTTPRGARSYELAPVEIWKYVITLAIDSSLLLSTSPFDIDWHNSSRVTDWICPMYDFDSNGVLYWGMHDKPAMKQFRSVRSTLRRVCRSWKVFVDSPYIEHRCMRFCVPSHADDERDPGQVVLARRIEIVNPPGATSRPDGALREAIDKGRMFDTEILLDIGGRVIPWIFPEFSASFPLLTALTIDFQNHSPLQNRSLLPLPEKQDCIILPQIFSLVTLVVCVEGPQQSLDPIFHKFPNLTSLSITSRRKLPHLDFSEWGSSLSHLELVGLGAAEQFTYFFSHLHRFASQIRSLRLVPCAGCHVFKINHDIWACRKLERLEMPLQLLILEEGKPEELARLKHIVHTDDRTLIMVGHDWTSLDFMKVYGICIGFCLKLRALKTVTDSHRWKSVFRLANTPLPLEDEADEYQNHIYSDQTIYSSVAASTMVLARKFQSIGIRFEDRYHITLTEARAAVGLTGDVD